MSWLSFFLFLVFLTSCSCYNNNQANYTIVKNDRIYINGMVDDFNKDIGKKIKSLGFDPIKIPPIHHNVSVSILFTTQTVKLNLTNGIIHGASNFTRAGDFVIRPMRNKMRLVGKIHIDKLYGSFNYSFSTFLYADSGVMNTTIENITALIQIEYILGEFRLLQPKMKITEIGEIKADLKSEATLIWFTNLVTNIALPYLKEQIIKISEETFLKIAQNVTDYANKNMIDILSYQISRFITPLFFGNYYGSKGPNRG